MKFDIAFVTYNSTKWLEKNLRSILASKYDLKNISLYYFDNASTDDTVAVLTELKEKYEKKFNEFKIVAGKKNKGFGYGSNKAAKLGHGDYVFFLNVDTEICSDTFSKLEEAIKSSSDEVGIFELKQEPYEHPKFYDPITGYTSWASGACMIMPRFLFKKTKGFDKNIFMYCEDVDLSWHVAKLGYKIKYLFNIPITHYSYEGPVGFKENSYIYGYINNLYLRCKYSKLRKIVRGHLTIFNAFRYNIAHKFVTNEEYKKIRNKMFKKYIAMMPKRVWVYLKSTLSFSKHKFQVKYYDEICYEVAKLDPFYTVQTMKEYPLVSVLVRTCGRPAMLRETLISLRNQTYPNVEVVVVEDGKNISEKMIKEEFKDLNIVYQATGEKVGRSKAGNLAMEIAHGKYLNFLDDDDLFFPEHVSVLVNEMEKNNAYVTYATAFETPIIIESKDPYIYHITDKVIRYHGNFSKIDLYKNNITPIQAVMFRKEVFENCGGFDTSIDALEDWDLWINFSLKYYFYHTERTTSLYRVPANQTISQERQNFLNSSLKYIMQKHANDKIELSPADIYYLYNKKED
ncbi:MAG: glycosyltransferase [Bacilli bacterium]|nr:glycosyltransferase [Bacilli bacterium]